MDLSKAFIRPSAFPGGGRESAPRNRLHYHYQRDGSTMLNMERSGQGLGDVRLTSGWQFFKGATDKVQHLSLRASLKLRCPVNSRHSSFKRPLAAC